MGKASRDKGARAELELVKIYQSHGFEEARRNHDQTMDPKDLPASFDIKTDVRGVDGIHIQAKRQETLKLPEWITQAETEAPWTSIPTVHFRRNYPNVPHEWWVALALADFIPMVRAWETVLNENRPLK